jgi:hypothetical protein
MALAAHILRLRVVVQRIFRNLSRRLQQVQLRPSVCLVAAHARHFTAGERIVAAAYGMTLVGMSHAVVRRERDRRHVPRGHSLGSTPVATQAKIIRFRSQKVSILRNVRIVAARTHPRGIGKMRIQERRRFMTLKAHNALGVLENDIRRVLASLDAVARSTSHRDGGMNVISFRVVGVAFQAVRVPIDSNRMRVGVAEARARQTGKHHAKHESRGESHSGFAVNGPEQNSAAFRSSFQPV